MTLDISCVACNGDGAALSLVVSEGYRLFQCTVCATQYFRPDRITEAPETASEYWEDYKFELYADKAVQEEYAQRFEAVFTDARTHIGPITSVLDVGCGIGNFVDHCRARSIEAYGIDVDEDAVKAAQLRGLAVATSGSLDKLLGEKSTHIDVVTLWDVIEHLYDPDPVIASISPALRNGGALALETPDGSFPIRSAILWLHRVTRGKVNLTSPLYYWEHKVYFTEAGLTIFLRRHGFQIVSIKRWTSPRAKMSKTFDHSAQSKNSNLQRVLTWVWPILETAFRRMGKGNKLIVIAKYGQKPTS